MRLPCVVVALACVVSIAGCSEDATPADGDETGSDGSTGGTSMGTSGPTSGGTTGEQTGSTTALDTGSSGGETGECPPGTEGCLCDLGATCDDPLVCLDGTCVPSSCGDGIVDGSEECDDGNDDDTDICPSTCTNAVCGDGFVGPGEGCDDGNAVDDDGCTNDCSLATCGDMVVDRGEECDDGNAIETDECLSTCVTATCGDAVTWAGNEECDDGNATETDTCLTTCVAASCGDGFVGPGEACDDGNNIDDDTCTNACAAPSCGDGIVQQGEDCDDQNANETDDCLSTCVDASCGDGFVWAGNEACDDGNADQTDDCLGNCEIASCGDGFVWAGNEACDDGNLVDTDECLSSCAAASCGDGFTWAGNEACDDGNLVDTDDCLSTCAAASCGDGFVWTGNEECDDGDSDNFDACPNDCFFPVCGDGIREGAEACDGTQFGSNCQNEGFDSGSLLCTGMCAIDTSGCGICGNAVIDGSEDCDGGQLGGQTCGSLGYSGGTLGCQGSCAFDVGACLAPIQCGDGLVAAGELCFAAPVVMSGDWYGVEVGDFDGDADLDVVAGRNGTEVRLMVNDGTGTLSYGPSMSGASGGPSYFAIGDVDGDNDLDLAFRVPAGIRIALNAGDATFPTSQDYSAFALPSGLQLVDVDSDNDLDLAVVDYTDNNIAVRLNNGSGTYGAQVAYDVPLTNGTFLEAGDVTGDGNLDLYASQLYALEIVVLPGLGTGFFDELASYTVTFSGSARHGLYAHLDGDAFLDLAVGITVPEVVAVKHGTGTGTLGAMTFEFPSGGEDAGGLVIDDFDSDGILDIAAHNTTEYSASDRNVAILVGDGSGLFYDPVVLDLVAGTQHGFAGGDLNGDTVPDLVTTSSVAGSGFGELNVFLSNP